MEPEKKSDGAFVGLAVIIIILVVGGIYIWQSNKNSMVQTPAQSGIFTTQDSVQLNSLEQNIKTTNTSAGVDVNSVN